MRLSVPRPVWALIAAGTIVRLVLAFTTDGQPYDMHVFRDLREVLSNMPLHVYEVPMGPGGLTHFPYPPGFFPIAYLAGAASSATGLAYGSLLRLPEIAADAAIALVVQDFLGRRGAAERVRLAATALVALGPSFIVISGYHGQLDSIAILPAVVALAIWGRAPESRRALYAGLLIGAGVAIKTTPAFMLLALLPSVRSLREAATLVGAAVAVPLAAIAPWLLTTPGDVIDALRYRGFPGTSGLSILLQPEFAEQLKRNVTPSSFSMFLFDRGQLLVGAAALAVTAFGLRFRAQWSPVERAAAIWIAFYVVTPAFFFQYLVWGLPFFVMAGRLRLALTVQAVALVPTVLFYRAPWEAEGPVVVYGIAMVALWSLFVVSLARILRERSRAAVA